MPGRQSRAKPRAFGPWVDPDLLPPLPRPKKNRKPKQKKRFHHSFRVLIALGLIPTKSRQCDPLGLRLNRMHVMEGDCEKSSGCLTAEGPPEIAKPVEESGDEKESARTKIPNGDHAGDELEAEKVPSPVNHDSDAEKVPSPSDGKENGDDAEESDKESEENDKSDKGELEAKEESNEEKVQEDIIETEKTSEELENEEMECEDEEIEEEKEEEKKDDEKEENEDEEKEDGKESEKEVDTKEIKEESLVKEEEINKTVPSPEKPSSPNEKPETDDVRPEERKTPTISIESRNEKSKRSIKREGEEEMSSGNESDSGRKKMRMEPVETRSNGTVQPVAEPFMDEREKMISDFVADCSRNSDEFDNYINELQKEVKTLTDMAKAKELEWNALLRVRKLKEEMLERILRQKRINTLHDLPEKSSLPEPKNYTNKTLSHGSQHELNMVPIVSSSPSLHSRSLPTTRNIHMAGDHNRSVQRPILPKPNSYILPYEQPRVVDVKSIIADFRARHPENVPRRGRRVPQVDDPSMYLNRQQQPMISVANLLLGSGSRVRTMRDSPYSYPQETPHPSSVEAARELENYKDHFKYNENANKAPPPYPEVTLHPVTRPNSPPTSSLLHGILTKTTPSPVHRPATFSPTLARLLTAPENPANPSAPVFRRPQNSQKMVSVADILKASKAKQQQQKGANEITITPVPGGPPAKPKEDVVLLDDDDAESSDRLVIDEGGENEDVPQCQGCKQKSSQFVCAGCGNQWYCSRECQVTAWEEHSEVCSG